MAAPGGPWADRGGARKVAEADRAAGESHAKALAQVEAFLAEHAGTL